VVEKKVVGPVVGPYVDEMVVVDMGVIFVVVVAMYSKRRVDWDLE
jgi:hypothetical protein